MSIILLSLLIIIPILEIYLFIIVGSAIGAGWTILAIFATAIFGMVIVRRQGLAVFLAARERQRAGAPPVIEAAHGVCILLAGAFLLLPGFFTDILGLLLLWNGFRSFLLAVLLESLLASVLVFNRPSMNSSMKSKNKSTDNKTIEGEYWRHDKSDKDD